MPHHLPTLGLSPLLALALSLTGCGAPATPSELAAQDGQTVVLTFPELHETPDPERYLSLLFSPKELSPPLRQTVAAQRSVSIGGIPKGEYKLNAELRLVETRALDAVRETTLTVGDGGGAATVTFGN